MGCVCTQYRLRAGTVAPTGRVICSLVCVCMCVRAGPAPAAPCSVLRFVSVSLCQCAVSGCWVWVRVVCVFSRTSSCNP